MEKFIEYKGLLSDRYEWNGGIRSNEKLTKKRRKMVEAGEAMVIHDEADFYDRDQPKKKVQRKS